MPGEEPHVSFDALRPGAVVVGPLLPEPVEILSIAPLGESLKLIGRGSKTNQVHSPVLTQAPPPKGPRAT